MPKKYVVLLATASVGLVSALGAALLLRRSRVEVPPVSPTVPRIEEFSRPSEAAEKPDSVSEKPGKVTEKPVRAADDEDGSAAAAS